MTLSEASAGEQPPPEQSLGAALRAAREAAGLTVDQVSATTRIRATLVRDLEDDRLASSGGAVYARGHVRALAHAIGVDPCPLVQLLDCALGEPSVSVGLSAAPMTLGPLPVAAAPERRGPRWLPAGLVAAVVLVGVFAVSSQLEDSPEPRDSVQLVTAPAPESPAPQAAAPPPPPPAPAGAELVLRIAGGASWISVSSPTDLLFEGEVPAGWAETFRHDAQVQVRIGNAAAVLVGCAGVAPAPAGERGQVRTLTCSTGGLAPA